MNLNNIAALENTPLKGGIAGRSTFQIRSEIKPAASAGKSAGKRRAAIFDVDLTLTRRDSMLLFLQFMLKRKPWLCFHVLPIGLGVILKSLRLIDGTALKNRLYRILDHCTAREVPELMSQFWKTVLVHDLSETGVALVRRHREQGDAIVLISASSDLYLKLLADFFQAEALICTQMKIVSETESSYRIHGENCRGENKLRRLQSHEIFPEIDWQNSYCYTDHHSDLPLLKLVGHPVVINGTRKLKRLARQYNWEIVEFS